MLLRRGPRAVAAWVGAATVALVTAHVVATDVAALHRRARAAGAEVDAVVAARDLPLGATVEQDDVTTRRRFERHLAPAALPDVDAALGRVVATPVLRGSVVSDRHLAPRSRTGLEGVVPPGMRAVRVVIEDGARPAPGSVVDVLVSFDPALVGGDVEPTMTVVEGGLVLAVDDRGPPDAVGDGDVGVTVLTDPEGARRLAFAAANGIVTLALAPPEEGADRR